MKNESDQPLFAECITLGAQRSALERKRIDDAKKVLWEKLGAPDYPLGRFLPNFRMGDFSVDFYCSSLKIGIILSGMVYKSREALDCIRDTYCAIHSIELLKIDYHDIFTDIHEVMLGIERFCSLVTIHRHHLRQPKETLPT